MAPPTRHLFLRSGSARDADRTCPPRTGLRFKNGNGALPTVFLHAFTDMRRSPRIATVGDATCGQNRYEKRPAFDDRPFFLTVERTSCFDQADGRNGRSIVSD